MGWMCVQTPYPPKEQPDAASGGSDAGEDTDNTYILEEEGETGQ